eukprot:Sspe_Gene.56037::Locus_30829_Transcript_2_2_Confidence_0.400_Length_5241::g.56037::m.56037
MDAVAAATLIGMGAGAVGGVAAVSLMLAAQLGLYKKDKGPEWYEVKKAYLCSKCGKYSCQAAACGACVGMAVADVDEVAMGAHPTAVIPDAMCAGCCCMIGCHCLRIGYKAYQSRSRRQAEEAQVHQDDIPYGIPVPPEDYTSPAKAIPSYYDEPALGQPVRRDRGIRSNVSSSSSLRGSRGALTAEEEEWFKRESERRQRNAELLRRNELPQYPAAQPRPEASSSSLREEVLRSPRTASIRSDEGHPVRKARSFGDESSHADSNTGVLDPNWEEATDGTFASTMRSQGGSNVSYGVGRAW